MKKIGSLMTILLFSLWLSGCGSSSDMQVNFTSDTYQAGIEAPLELIVKKDNQEAPGMEVMATFEMKTMDHDTLEVPFSDAGNGKYSGKAIFPMSGDWQAYITISDGKQKEEVLVPIKIKE